MEEISHIGAIDTVRVLANEERLRLLRLLMRGPATLTQLGVVVGHHPAWVRHHILSLEQAGLVELVETRPTKGYVEKFYCATARAYAVDFMVLPDEGERGLLVLLGSDDRALDLLARRLREDEAGPDVITMAMGSLEGLIALRHGIGHVAGCHLFDAETGDFNKTYARALFPGRALMLVTLAHRQQGLIVPPGNPRGLQDLADAVDGRRAHREPQSRFRHARVARPAAGRRSPGSHPGRRLRQRGDDARRGRAGRGRGRGRRRARHPARGEGATGWTSSLWSKSATTWSPRASTTRATCSRPCSSC